MGNTWGLFIMLELGISESWNSKKLTTLFFIYLSIIYLSFNLSHVHTYIFSLFLLKKLSCFLLLSFFSMVSLPFENIIMFINTYRNLCFDTGTQEKILCNHTQNMRKIYLLWKIHLLWKIPRPLKLKYVVSRVFCLPK